MMDIAKLNIEINSSKAKQAKTDLDHLTRSGEKSERQMGTMSKAAVRLGTALAAAFASYKIAQFTKEVALAAARYETLGVVLNQVGRNAGLSAKQVNDYAKQVRESGIQMDTARQVTIRMIQAQVDMTKASQLARIAQDAAVIGNINSSEALERMIHGIQSAQIEVLRGIGLNVNFENSYKKLAGQLGIATKELSESQKMQARTNVVLAEGARIAGVYEESMDTAGKQISSFIRYVNDFKIEMGQAFNPATAEVVKSMTAAMKELTTAVSSPEIQKQLGLIADEVGEWVSKNAELFSQDLPNHLKTAANAAELTAKGLIAVGSGLSLIINGFMALPDWVKSVGIISAFFFGKKAAVVIATLSAVIGQLKELNAQFDAIPQSSKIEALIERERIAIEKLNKQYKDLRGADVETYGPGIQRQIAEREERLRSYTEMLEKAKKATDALAISTGKFGTGIGEGQFGDVPLILEKIKDNAGGAGDGVKDLADQFSYLNHEMYEKDYGDPSDGLVDYKQWQSAWTSHNEALAADWKKAHEKMYADTARMSDLSELVIYEYGQKVVDISEEAADGMSNAFDGWAAGFSATLNDALWESENTFESIVRSFSKMITQMMIQENIAKPFTDWLKPMVTGMFSGGGSGGGIGSFFGSLFGSAKGNVFDNISGYSNQIVSQPTPFAFAGMRQFEFGGGIMGEAGPEAVMPLTRTSSGDLGVRVERSEPNVTVNNVFYVTPDERGNVSKQSQYQIARAASKGMSKAMGR